MNTLNTDSHSSADAHAAGQRCTLSVKESEAVRALTQDLYYSGKPLAPGASIGDAVRARLRSLPASWIQYDKACGLNAVDFSLTRQCDATCPIETVVERTNPNLITRARSVTTKLDADIRNLNTVPVDYYLLARLRWEPDRVLAARVEFLSFLQTIRADPATPCSPNDQADEYWHVAISLTPYYHAMCQALFGRYLHHWPYSQRPVVA